MTTTKKLTLTALLAAGLLGDAPAARAGWDNVFQVTCFRCRERRASAYRSYAPAPVVVAQYAPVAPPAQASTVIETREYQVDVTVMKPVPESVPVQVVERRSIVEPQTTTRRSSYYNPATCRYEEFEDRQTNLVRKEVCETVTKIVERTRMVPTVEKRTVVAKRPVTTITQYGPETHEYQCNGCDLPGAPRGVAPPSVSAERLVPPSASVGPRLGPQNVPQGLTNGTTPAPMAAPPATRPKPAVNANTTGYARAALVSGEVVERDQATPRPGVKVIFTNDAKQRIETTADAGGQFDADLPAGEWHVYLGTGTGKALFYKTVTVGDAAKNLVLVSK